MKVVAFTYRITNKLDGKWYYGVKYDKNCNTDVLGVSYFSSSRKLKILISTIGKDNFKFEIRKIFTDTDLARLWEVRVLKRFKASKNSMLYNEHNCMGFSIMVGDDNPSKRTEVREKLSSIAKNRKPMDIKTINKIKNTKLIKNIIDIIKFKKILPKRNTSIKLLNKYLEFTNKKYLRIYTILENIKNSLLDELKIIR